MCRNDGKLATLAFFTPRYGVEFLLFAPEPNQPLMGSYSNVDDTVLSVPGVPSRGVALRSFDPKTRQGSIWWLDSRTPSEPLDPPMIGGFHNGVGTFYGNDTVKGKQVRARFIWSNITPTSAH